MGSPHPRPEMAVGLDQGENSHLDVIGQFRPRTRESLGDGLVCIRFASDLHRNRSLQVFSVPFCSRIRVGEKSLQFKGLRRFSLNTPSRSRTCNLRFRRPTANLQNTNSDSDLQPIADTGSSNGSSSPPDPDLARVVEAWATLPEPLRRAVLALVGSAERPQS